MSDQPVLTPSVPRPGKPLALLNTRIISCGDHLERGGIDTPFNFNRNGEAFWGETKAPRRAFGDGHASTPDSLARTTNEGTPGSDVPS